MNIKRLLFLITFMAVFAMAARVSIDSDTWWHLATGKLILESGSVPQTDPFSHTRAAAPWLYPSTSWLMQITLYSIYSHFGAGGLNLFTALMVTLAFLVVYHTLDSGPFLRAFVIIFAAAISGVYWAARPYLMTFLLTALGLKVLEDFRSGRKDRLWLMPLIMLVWVNSHGGWAYGLILWGLYGLAFGLEWLAQARQPGALLPTDFSRQWLAGGLRGAVGRMLLIGLLMLLAVCINPAGAHILQYPFQTVAIESLQDHIAEWQSPDFHQRNVQPFLWMLLLLFGILNLSQKKLQLTEYLLLIIFTSLSLIAARNIAMFALVIPIILSRQAAPLAEKLGQRFGYRGISDSPPARLPNIVNWLLFGLLLLSVLLKAASVFPASMNDAYIHQNMPAGAVAYLKQHQPPGELLNSYNWGGYLIWHLPDYPVFVDGRTDLYGDQLLDEWFELVRAEGSWQSGLQKWKVNLVLLEPSTPLARELKHDPGWSLLYQDQVSLLYGRQP